MISSNLINNLVQNIHITTSDALYDHIYSSGNLFDNLVKPSPVYCFEPNQKDGTECSFCTDQTAIGQTAIIQIILQQAINFRTLLVLLSDVTVSDASFPSYTLTLSKANTQLHTFTLQQSSIIYDQDIVMEADEIKLSFDVTSGNQQLCLDSLVALDQHWLNAHYHSKGISKIKITGSKDKNVNYNWPMSKNWWNKSWNLNDCFSVNREVDNSEFARLGLPNIIPIGQEPINIVTSAYVQFGADTIHDSGTSIISYEWEYDYYSNTYEAPGIPTYETVDHATIFSNKFYEFPDPNPNSQILFQSTNSKNSFCATHTFGYLHCDYTFTASEPSDFYIPVGTFEPVSTLFEVNYSPKLGNSDLMDEDWCLFKSNFDYNFPDQNQIDMVVDNWNDWYMIEFEIDSTQTALVGQTSTVELKLWDDRQPTQITTKTITLHYKPACTFYDLEEFSFIDASTGSPWADFQYNPEVDGEYILDIAIDKVPNCLGYIHEKTTLSFELEKSDGSITQLSSSLQQFETVQQSQSGIAGYFDNNRFHLLVYDAKYSGVQTINVNVHVEGYEDTQVETDGILTQEFKVHSVQITIVIPACLAEVESSDSRFGVGFDITTGVLLDAKWPQGILGYYMGETFYYDIVTLLPECDPTQITLVPTDSDPQIVQKALDLIDSSCDSSIRSCIILDQPYRDSFGIKVKANRNIDFGRFNFNLIVHPEGTDPLLKGVLKTELPIVIEIQMNPMCYVVSGKVQLSASSSTDFWHVESTYANNLVEVVTQVNFDSAQSALNRINQFYKKRSNEVVVKDYTSQLFVNKGYEADYCGQYTFEFVVSDQQDETLQVKAQELLTSGQVCDIEDNAANCVGVSYPTLKSFVVETTIADLDYVGVYKYTMIVYLTEFHDYLLNGLINEEPKLSIPIIVEVVTSDCFTESDFLLYDSETLDELFIVEVNTALKYDNNNDCSFQPKRQRFTVRDTLSIKNQQPYFCGFYVYELSIQENEQAQNMLHESCTDCVRIIPVQDSLYVSDSVFSTFDVEVDVNSVQSIGDYKFTLNTWFNDFHSQNLDNEPNSPFLLLVNVEESENQCVVSGGDRQYINYAIGSTLETITILELEIKSCFSQPNITIIADNDLNKRKGYFEDLIKEEYGLDYFVLTGESKEKWCDKIPEEKPTVLFIRLDLFTTRVALEDQTVSFVVRNYIAESYIEFPPVRVSYYLDPQLFTGNGLLESQIPKPQPIPCVDSEVAKLWFLRIPNSLDERVTFYFFGGDLGKNLNYEDKTKVITIYGFQKNLPSNGIYRTKFLLEDRFGYSENHYIDFEVKCLVQTSDGDSKPEYSFDGQNKTVPVPKVSEITRNGKVIINWSTPMQQTEISVYGRKLVSDEQEIIDVQIIQGSKSDQIKPDAFQFSFTLGWENEYTSVIKLEIAKPEYISTSSSNKDLLQIRFIQNSAFISLDGIPMSPKFVIVQELPKQMPKNGAIPVDKEQMQTTTIAAFGLSLAIGFFRKAVINQALAIISFLSYLTHMYILTLEYPPNVNDFFAGLFPLITFDLFPMIDEFLDLFFHFEDNNEESISDQFEQSGYESTFIVKNLGSLFLIPIFQPALAFAVLLVSICCPCWKCCFPTPKRKVQNKVDKFLKAQFWNDTLEFIEAAYLVWLMCALIGVWDLRIGSSEYSWSEKFNSWFAIFMLAFCIIYPIHMAVLYCFKIKSKEITPDPPTEEEWNKINPRTLRLQFDTDDRDEYIRQHWFQSDYKQFKKKYGLLIKGLRLTELGKPLTIFFAVLPSIASLALCSSIILYLENPTFTIFSFFFNVLAYITVHEYFRPKKKEREHRIDMINEYVLLIALYHLLTFTEWTDVKQKQITGNSIIIFTYAATAFFFLVELIPAVHKQIRKLKRNYIWFKIKSRKRLNYLFSSNKEQQQSKLEQPINSQRKKIIKDRFVQQDNTNKKVQLLIENPKTVVLLNNEQPQEITDSRQLDMMLWNQYHQNRLIQILGDQSSSNGSFRPMTPIQKQQFVTQKPKPDEITLPNFDRNSLTMDIETHRQNEHTRFSIYDEFQLQSIDKSNQSYHKKQNSIGQLLVPRPRRSSGLTLEEVKQQKLNHSLSRSTINLQNAQDSFVSQKKSLGQTESINLKPKASKKKLSDESKSSSLTSLRNTYSYLKPHKVDKPVLNKPIMPNQTILSKKTNLDIIQAQQIYGTYKGESPYTHLGKQ